MAYEKQIWNKYDDLKTEEENIENGAVVTDNRMNHIEEGIEAHTADLKNPHKVTAAQVGLGDVQNFGLATEDEAKQGISNAKYMTPSLTQAVLSANINSIAYANSADGTDGFTTVYPNLNLLDGTKDFSGTWTNSSSWVTDGTYKGLTVKTQNVAWVPISKKFTVLTSGTYTISEYVRNTGASPAISYLNVNGSVISQINNGTNFDWKKVSFTRALSAGDVIVLETHNGTTRQISIAGYKVENSLVSTAWMPSSSEVTTADWPKYVGFSNTVKTNKSASDYTWFPVKDSELTNKVESHINNKANPHVVTASQVGAYSKTEADSKLALKANDSEVVHKTGNETISGSKNFASITVTDTFTERTTTVNITGFYTLTLTLCRTGNDVELISTRTAISSAAGHEQTDAGFTIPSGFRPISRALAKVEMNNSTTLYNPMILRLDSDGKTYLTNEVFSNNRYAQCYATWKTTDPWPTTN